MTKNFEQIRTDVARSVILHFHALACASIIFSVRGCALRIHASTNDEMFPVDDLSRIDASTHTRVRDLR